MQTVQIFVQEVLVQLVDLGGRLVFVVDLVLFDQLGELNAVLEQFAHRLEGVAFVEHATVEHGLNEFVVLLDRRPR